MQTAGATWEKCGALGQLCVGARHACGTGRPLRFPCLPHVAPGINRYIYISIINVVSISSEGGKQRNDEWLCMARKEGSGEGGDDQWQQTWAWLNGELHRRLWLTVSVSSWNAVGVHVSRAAPIELLNFLFCYSLLCV